MRMWGDCGERRWWGEQSCLTSPRRTSEEPTKWSAPSTTTAILCAVAQVHHVTLGQHVRRGGLETQLRQRAGELRVRRAGGGLGGLE